jgi:hypothetical protein
MTNWPDLAELKQVLDVESSDWDGDSDDSRLTALLAASIDGVKGDVGKWDETNDEPDAALNRAALRLAELNALRPEAAVSNKNDPTYLRYLKGHRRSFGIA